MLNKLNFADQNLFFVSCLHLGHDKEFIYKPRGFTNVQEHNEALVTRWNEKITNNDTVFSIGDTIFGQNADVRLEEYFRRLNFKRLYLSPGNHFAGWHQLYKRELNKGHSSWTDVEIYPLAYTIPGTEKTVYFMPNYYEIYVGHQAIVLCHYPVLSWNGIGKGVWHLFGHTHPNKQTVYEGKQTNVCIEYIDVPISFNEVKRLMDKKEIKGEGHHTAKTQYAI